MRLVVDFKEFIYGVIAELVLSGWRPTDIEVGTIRKRMFDEGKQKAADVYADVAPNASR